MLPVLKIAFEITGFGGCFLQSRPRWAVRAELSGFSPTWLRRPVFTWAWNPSVSNFTPRRGSAASFSHCMEFFLPQAAGVRGLLATSQIPLLSASCKRQKDRPFNFCTQRPLVLVFEKRAVPVDLWALPSVRGTRLSSCALIGAFPLELV